MSTLTLQQSINWAIPQMGFRPAALGTGNEPATSNGNIILQTILGPPFCWRFNRAAITFTTVKGTQDYSVSVADFGFIEKANVATSADTKEITIQNCLALDSKQGRPNFVAPQMDYVVLSPPDNGITFRLMPVPDDVYTATITYQKKAPLFAGLSQTWSPLPDEYSYIFNRGFLSLYLLANDDPKFQIENAKFVSSLLGAAEGLTEMQRNIFLANWAAVTRTEMAAGIKTQQGNQARGV